MPAPLPQVHSDYRDVVRYLQAKGVFPLAPSPDLQEASKTLHKHIYALMWWRFRFSRLPAYGRVFLVEIASDALQLLPQSLMGYRKPTSLLLRGVVENVLRHIYYRHHPIEYERMNEEHEWHIPTKDLFAYLRRHPTFSRPERTFDAINRLSLLYHDLSLDVHGVKVIHLEMRPGLESITLDKKHLMRYVRLVKRCSEAANCLLATFHRERFLRLPFAEQKVILSCLPKKARAVVAGRL